jgi:CubicO group peptidase (beta-lactamase class C family)
VSLPLSASQPSVPKTPAGAQLAEFLRLCDAPDIKAFTVFETEQAAKPASGEWNPAQDARGDVNFCERMGGLRLESTEQSGENKVTAVLQARATEEWVSLTIVVEPDAAHKIGSFALSPGEPPANAVPAGLSDEQIAAEMKRWGDKLAASGRLSGVVLVAKDGKPIFQRAYGLADRETNRANEMNSIFTIGSMGKMFTATAVAQLVDQGKLSFDEPVGKILPDYPTQDVREKVTVGMLLTHTSGLGDFLGRRTPAMREHGVKAAAEYVALFASDPLKFEPGKGWSYSNAAFALAGAIVEKVSGQSYFAYVRDHIFKPAGMTGCDTNETRAVPARMVTPYGRKEGGNWNEREPAERDIGNPAGGSACTAPDLLRFALALQGGELVSKRTFAELIAPHSKPPFGGGYGYGFEIRRQGDRRVVGHGGGFPGVSAKLDMFLEQGYVVVVLSNYDMAAITVAEKVRPMILRK